MFTIIIYIFVNIKTNNIRIKGVMFEITIVTPQCLCKRWMWMTKFSMHGERSCTRRMVLFINSAGMKWLKNVNKALNIKARFAGETRGG